jgi:hypothetical protein
VGKGIFAAKIFCQVRLYQHKNKTGWLVCL